MVSDNATTYLSSAEELKRLQDSITVKEALSRHGCDWIFIPKRAPWYGGFWERLIGLTKNTLEKVLGRALITLSDLTNDHRGDRRHTKRPTTHLHICWY